MSGEPFIPPYPKPHPRQLSWLGRAIAGWGSSIHTLFERSYTMKMGEIRMPGFHFFIPNTMDLTQHILQDPQAYPKHDFLHEVLYPLIGDSVFTINGQAWKDARAMVNPAFAHTHLNRAFPTMDAAVTDLIEHIRTKDLEAPLHIDPLMTHVTADIIFRTIMSHTLSLEETAHVFRAFERYQRWIQPAMTLRTYRIPAGLIWRRIRAAAKDVHAVFDPVVRARFDAYHRGDAGPEDILHALMQARHPTTGKPFTYEELRDQVGIIFLAGHETSATALTWALYLIGSCPDLQQTLYEEATAETLSPDRLRRMTQILDTFRETMRLYPPVSFLMRAVRQPETMRGKQVKPGDQLLISPWIMQRKEEHFPCPHAFMPERFRDPAQADACKRAYMPFGAGPRVCIGAGFAQQEAVVVLARLLQHFRIEVPEGERPEPTTRLTLRPKNGIRLRLVPRH